MNDPEPAWWRRHKILTGLGITALIWLVLGRAPGSPDGILRAECNADGSWPATTLAQGGWLSVSLGFHSTDSQHQITSSKMSTPGCRLGSRHLLIVLRSPDPLAAHVGAELATAMQGDPGLQSITLQPHGVPPIVGADGPDIVVSLAVTERGGAAILGLGNDRATVVCTAGNRLWPGRSTHFGGRLSHPEQEWQLEGSFTAQSKMAGVCTGSAAQESMAKALGEPMAKAIRDVLDDLRAEHGSLPLLPAAFDLPFTPIAITDLPLAALPDLRLLASWKRPLCANETWWQTTVNAPWAPALDRLRDAMVAAGFADAAVLDGERVLGTRGSETLEVVADPPRAPVFVGAAFVIPAAEPPSGPVPVLVRYCRQATAAELATAIAATLAEDAAPGLVGLFESIWTDAQRDVAMQRLLAAPIRDPETLLARARLRHDPDGARRDVAVAWCLRRALGRNGTTPIDQAAQRLGTTTPDLPVPDAEALRQAGLVPVVAGQDNPQPVSPDRPALWFLAAEDGVIQSVAGASIQRVATGWQGSISLATVTGSASTFRGAPPFGGGLQGLWLHIDEVHGDTATATARHDH